VARSAEETSETLLNKIDSLISKSMNIKDVEVDNVYRIKDTDKICVRFLRQKDRNKVLKAKQSLKSRLGKIFINPDYTATALRNNFEKRQLRRQGIYEGQPAKPNDLRQRRGKPPQIQRQS